MWFQKKLREAAMRCSNVDYRSLLKQAADSVEFCIEAFYREQTEDRLRDLNGAWSFGVRLLKSLPPEGTPAPLSGSPEPAILAARSAA